MKYEQVKILIYLLLSASEDTESQRKGITSIVLPGVKFNAQKESNKVSLDRLVFMKRVYGILPIRTSAIHFCLPSTPYINIFRTAIFMTMSKLRHRMKFHTGTCHFDFGVRLCSTMYATVDKSHQNCLSFDLLSYFSLLSPSQIYVTLKSSSTCLGESVEVQYILRGYGIPVELIPLTDTGNIKTNYLKQWIKLRMNLEALNENGKLEQVSIIDCPGSNDVVYRPGTSVSCHLGNYRFRGLLENITGSENMGTHAQMAEQLIQKIGSCGGRFLKWNTQGYWIAMSDAMLIHSKVSLSIRDFKYKTKAQRINRQNNQSYTYLFCQDGRKRNREEGMGDLQNPHEKVKLKVRPVTK